MLAIQGHLDRGKEVIQILESLGGINRLNHNGHYTNCFYYVAGDDNTIAWTCVRPQYRDVFTLEEFEKEFPYKIGETVITTLNHVGTIIGIANSKYKVMFKEDNALIAPRRLKPYKEMKEKRNIVLTLDKAQEWYNKGGELKEIALQAFTEKELNPLPRSWDEFCNTHSVITDDEYFITSDSCIDNVNDVIPNHYRLNTSDRNICPSRKSAEAHLAMIQLEQLRDCWRQGWEPIWDISEKWCIRLWGNELSIGVTTNISRFLTFPTKEMAEEFLKCFRDLIEKAGDLI